MRVLMIPQIVVGEVAAESDYYYHKSYMRALLELEPCWFYVWLRAKDEKRLPNDRNCTYFCEDLALNFYNQMGVWGGRLVENFHRVFGRYPVDLIISSRAGAAAGLSIGLADRQYMPVPTLISEPHVYGRNEPSHNKVSFHDAVIRGAGYAVSLGIYHSRWEKQSAINCAAEFLAQSVLKWMDENMIVVDDLVDIPPVETRTEPPKRKRVIFAGRLNENKRWPTVMRAYADVLMARSDLEVWVHAGTGLFNKLRKDKNKQANFRWHRASERLPYDEYLDLLRTSHVGAYWSHDEGVNISVLEMLLSGVVMVLPNRPWVEKLFWPLTYPFIASKPEEIAPMVDYLLDHYLEGYRQLEPIRKQTIERHGWPTFLSKFRQVYDRVKQMEQPGPYRKFRERVLELMKDTQEPLSFWTAVEAMGMQHYWHHPGMVKYSSMYACYQSVRDMDDMQGPEPMLRRV